MHVRDIQSIDLDALWASGYRGILIDLDNTLVPYGHYDPIPDESLEWLKKALSIGFKLALYSNASKWKVDLIRKQLGMFCVHKAIKPFPLKLNVCLENIDVPKEKTVTIGDQLFTDILGGNWAGMFTILVEPIHKRDFLGTKILRFLERVAGRKPLEN
jgi:HAD superfamily phosphatase (TIGR01668 family)